MILLIILTLILLAFACEFVDSSLGMGYGTILSPILLLMGFDVFVVVPSILISETVTGFTAGILHKKWNNVVYVKENGNSRIVALVSVLGMMATIITVIIVLNIDKFFIKTYIGVLVIALGILLISGKKFKFTWNKICSIAIISGVNKAISGGGFGPVLTSGQIISGRGTKEAIGVTTICEAPICIVGFIMYYLLNGFIDFMIPMLLVLGGLVGAFSGAFTTKKFKENIKIRKIVGLVCFLSGMFVIIKLVI